jgi:hypothetical protein
MDVGMLWFDNDPKSDLATKVKRGAEYYRRKYGMQPNICFVHPSSMPSAAMEVNHIKICADSSMLPHHLWIGIQGQDEAHTPSEHIDALAL